MLIKISVSPSKNQAMLCADREGWRALAEAVRVAGEQSCTVAATERPEHYEAFARIVRAGDSLSPQVLIRIDEPGLFLILGNESGRLWLSGNMDEMVDATPGFHCHIDDVSFPDELDPESADLIFLREP